MVAFGIVLHHLHGLQLFQAGLLGNLVLAFVGVVLQVAYVGDIAHIAHLVAQILQQAEQHVIGDARTGVAQMGVSVNGGAAHVHTHAAFVDGFEYFLIAGKGIGQI